MTITTRRRVGATVLAAACAATLAAAPASGDTKDKPKGNPNLTTVQLLSFNDYHGHLEATDPKLTPAEDPSQTPVGGAEYLSTTLSNLRSKVGKGSSLTVAAGDLIGGSPFLSGMFHDEPSVESLNQMGLDVSSVGNHEFDEGTDELLRMQNGGCHPTDGCYFPQSPYAGADFQWLSANVVRKDNGKTLLPGTSVKTVNGVKIGFIGMTLEATPTLVSPAGVSSVDFLDEVQTANAQAAALKKQGVKSIVVLLHEGGYQTGTINDCNGISAPIAQIAAQITPEVDQIITGHTHQAYICSLPDPAGNDRLVTSAHDYGRAVTETSLVINTKSGEVMRDRSTATNHLVAQTAPKDGAITKIIDKWNTLAGPLKAQIVGTHTEDILGDSSGNRGIETPMADVVADAILAGTDGPNEGGAQIAFMNVGGVREDLPMKPKYSEAPGQITYAEAFDIAPFNNLLVSIDLTGDQIRQVLEQQYQPVAARGSRPMLALGVSKGFTYDWDASQPQGSRVVNGSMALNGAPIEATKTYRVGTLNFLADGGDLFTAFTQGTNRAGGPEDLANLVAYFQANPGLTAPASRIGGL
ncbi:bifunctional metallophosphatase/5'-nucleotidase [Knoellia sp. LjRoot47]|uniref:bifunctional metallophosphatase/5'-nucleotidase n=1 Tax=Knoellia sp. LjRoot47 TaxID=3342330 RepID=UPI003ECD8D69